MALPVVYHWRSLFVRKTTTLLTVLVVATVVSVFAWMIGFARAMSGSISMAGDHRKLIILKRGATAESNSAIPIDEYSKLSSLADLARDGAGQPLISPEMVVQVSLPRLRDGGKTNANVAVRGVNADIVLKVHSNVTTGRMFGTGAREVIVGEATAKQFAGLNIGDTINLGYGGDRGYEVAAHFTAGGGPMESEIWAYLPSLMNSYHRTMYSSANLRIRDGADPKAVIEQIKGPAIQLEAQSEAEYWQSQSLMIRNYLKIAYVLLAVMCLAAVFSIANTMFSAVSGRTQEIAMLRTIGFGGRHILLGFMIEAVLLSLIGGVLGCLAAAGWLAIIGNTKDMFAATTFTTLAFEIRMTPWIVAVALGSVSLVGMLGALVPAARAARLSVVSALREP